MYIFIIFLILSAIKFFGKAIKIKTEAKIEIKIKVNLKIGVNPKAKAKPRV